MRRVAAPVLGIVVALATLAAFLPATSAAPALPPPAPAPTAHGKSPEKPDPHPRRGGIGPDGQPVGGGRMLSRGLVLPAGAPTLPAHLTARAWMLTDLDTGAVLAARDPHGRYQPASILKALTSLVLLAKLPGRRVVTVGAAAANAEGSAVGLVAGGKYTVDTLFKSLLLMSGNDAALALAEAGGGTQATVAAMNREILALGGYDTYVQTPSGLDGWRQLTSVYDMSLVLRAVAAQPRFLGYDRALTARLPAQRVRRHTWRSVPLYNQGEDFFAAVPGAILTKSGYTDAALHTYICAARRHGQRLGVVFLRAERIPRDQYQQAAALFSWAERLPRAASVGTLDPVAPFPLPTSRSAPANATTLVPAAVATRHHDRGSGSVLPLGVAAAAVLGAAALAEHRRRRRFPRR